MLKKLLKDEQIVLALRRAEAGISPGEISPFDD